jgi:hypothetical protein
VAVTLLFSVTVIYMAADFRHPLPKPFPGDCCGAFCEGERASTVRGLHVAFSTFSGKPACQCSCLRQQAPDEFY